MTDLAQVLDGVEDEAIAVVLDSLREAVEALPTFYGTQHDHPKTEGPVDRHAVLDLIEGARP